MARDQLLGDVARDRLEVARAALGEEQREEVRLEEQVAELVEQLRVVARERRVRDLVGLLDRVRHDRPLGLLAIPGTFAAQALRQLLELDERVGKSHPDRATWSSGSRSRERRAGIGRRRVSRSGTRSSRPSSSSWRSSSSSRSRSAAASAIELLADRRRGLLLGRRLRRRDRRDRLDHEPAVLRRLDRLDQHAGLRRRAKTAASNSGTSLPLVAVNLPPLSFEPGSCEYFFASAAKSAPALSCV